MTKRKIVLQFITGVDEDHRYCYKKKALRNIRPDLTDEQMSEFVSRFCALTAYALAEAVVVDERLLVLETESELIEKTPQAEQEAMFLKEGQSMAEKEGMTASFKESEATLDTHEAELTPFLTAKELQVQANEATTSREKPSTNLAEKPETEKMDSLAKTTPAALNQKQKSLKRKDQSLPVAKASLTDKKKPLPQAAKVTTIKLQEPLKRKDQSLSVAQASLTEKVQPLPQAVKATTKQTQASFKLKDQNLSVAQASQTKKAQPLPQAVKATTKQMQASKLKEQNPPDVKDQGRSKLKQQNLPLAATAEQLELGVKNSLLAKKAAALEENVIETVLDASQAYSVDDLIELVEKSELGLISEKKLSLETTKTPPSMSIDEWFLNHQTDPDLTKTPEHLSQSFVMPVKKKRMRPPVGKLTKPSKKKKR